MVAGGSPLDRRPSNVVAGAHRLRAAAHVCPVSDTTPAIDGGRDPAVVASRGTGRLRRAGGEFGLGFARGCRASALGPGDARVAAPIVAAKCSLWSVVPRDCARRVLLSAH